MSRWYNKQVEDLFKAIIALENREEAKKFFRDLLTESEIKEFSNRWQAAQMLDGGVSYSKIEKQTGLSSTTIARISKWLNKGKGGYKLIISRLGQQHSHHSSSEGVCL